MEPVENPSELAKRIGIVLGKRKSERPGLTQRNLAAGIGISESALSQWANGKSRPSLENLAQFADKMDVDLKWLMSGVGPDPDTPPWKIHPLDEKLLIMASAGSLAYCSFIKKAPSPDKFGNFVLWLYCRVMTERKFVPVQELTAEQVDHYCRNSSEDFPTPEL